MPCTSICKVFEELILFKNNYALNLCVKYCSTNNVLLQNSLFFEYWIQKHLGISNFYLWQKQTKTWCLITELIIFALSCRIKGNAGQETSKRMSSIIND